MNRLRTWFSYSIYPLIVGGGGALIVYGIGNNFSYWLVVPPVLIAAALAVMFLERAMPYEKEPTPAPLGVDATHYIVNYGIKQAALMLYAQLVGNFGIFGFLWISSWWFAAQAILALVIIDLFLYWIHRWSHENAFLWQFHELHHSAEQLYWVNGEKRHLLHQIIEGLPGITVVMLLGAPAAAVVAALAILTLNMMLQHANIDYRAGVLRYLFSVAELHRWHHLRDYERTKVNFAAWLVIWDLIFKTYSYSPGRVSWNKNRNEIGVAAAHPQTYSAQFLHPFKKIRQRAAKRRAAAEKIRL